MDEQLLYKKLNKIEKQIDVLKLIMAGAMQNKNKKMISLKGLLSGVEISESDISESKKSLFKL